MDLPIGKYNVTAVVCEEPIEQTEQHRTVITVKNARADGRAVKGKIRIYIYSTRLEYEVGQSLKIENCKLSIPDGVTNPNGFDFNAYLWRNGVSLCGSANAENITVIGEEGSLKRTLYRIRRDLCGISDRLFEDSSDVMRAVLLGDRSGLSDETYEDFSRVGIAHIIALSGLHVSAIALALDWIMKRLRFPRTLRSLISVVLLVLYTVMTGAGSSTIRAVLMYAILCIDREMGYPSDTLTRMGIAFLIQLGFNPLLIGDNGFVLSYISVAAILSFSEAFLNAERMKRLPQPVQTVINAGSASFAVQTVTFPLLSGMFYSVSAVSVPINMICVPFAILALYLGAASLGLGCISIKAAAVIGWPAKMLWRGIKILCKTVSGWSVSQITACPWPVWLMVLFFVIAIRSGVYLARTKTGQRIGLGLLVMIILLFLIWPIPKIDHLQITFVDVGYGDGTVVNAQGSTYVIDCGRDNGIVADFLSSERRNVKAIFVSHPDSDHIGGLKEILARYPWVKVYLPSDWNKLEVNEETARLIENTNVVYLSQGDSVALSEEVNAHVIWPPADFEPDSDNNGCLVLKIEYKQAEALFMADVTDKFDASCAVDTDVLKVAHHGSKYATTERFLSGASPEISVISVGGNSFGHPTEQVLTRLKDIGSEILRTDQCGAIIMDLYEDGRIEYTSYLEAVS